jgi:hypothetical protein
VFYCSKKPSPPPRFVCHGLVFQSALDMFHCFTNSNPPFHMWSLSSYISLFHLVFFVVLSNSPHPHLSSLLFYSSWEPKSHCWLSFLFMKRDPSPYHVLLVLWSIILCLQPILLGLWRVTHSYCFSQFVKPKSLFSFLLVWGVWSPCFVFLGFRNLIPLSCYSLFMKFETFVLFILFVLMFFRTQTPIMIVEFSASLHPQL